jgi:hypothetical protein
MKPDVADQPGERSREEIEVLEQAEDAEVAHHERRQPQLLPSPGPPGIEPESPGVAARRDQREKQAPPPVPQRVEAVAQEQ